MKPDCTSPSLPPLPKRNTHTTQVAEKIAFPPIHLGVHIGYCPAGVALVDPPENYMITLN